VEPSLFLPARLINHYMLRSGRLACGADKESKARSDWKRWWRLLNGPHPTGAGCCCRWCRRHCPIDSQPGVSYFPIGLRAGPSRRSLKAFGHVVQTTSGRPAKHAISEGGAAARTACRLSGVPSMAVGAGRALLLCAGGAGWRNKISIDDRRPTWPYLYAGRCNNQSAHIVAADYRTVADAFQRSASPPSDVITFFVPPSPIGGREHYVSGSAVRLSSVR